MKNKIIAGVLVTLFFLPVYVYAQEGEQSVDAIMAKMKTELNLTKAQVDAVKPIIEENIAKRQAVIQTIKEQNITDKNMVRDRLEELKEEENQKLSQVLNKDQMKHWSDLQNQRHHGHQHGGHGGGRRSSGTKQ